MPLRFMIEDFYMDYLVKIRGAGSMPDDDELVYEPAHAVPNWQASASTKNPADRTRGTWWRVLAVKARARVLRRRRRWRLRF